MVKVFQCDLLVVKGASEELGTNVIFAYISAVKRFGLEVYFEFEEVWKGAIGGVVLGAV